MHRRTAPAHPNAPPWPASSTASPRPTPWWRPEGKEASVGLQGLIWGGAMGCARCGRACSIPRPCPLQRGSSGQHRGFLPHEARGLGLAGGHRRPHGGKGGDASRTRSLGCRRGYARPPRLEARPWVGYGRRERSSSGAAPWSEMIGPEANGSPLRTWGAIARAMRASTPTPPPKKKK